MEDLANMVGKHEPDIIVICEVLPKNYRTKPTIASVTIEGYDTHTNIEI